jgi:Fe-S-cluster containining protein
MQSEILCSSVLTLLAGAETAAIRFGRDSGLACPGGCGDCCSSQKPEDSVLSALPAARWAVESDFVEALEAAALERPEGPCVFFDADADKHCMIYPLRPLVCRLFGFAGRRDKHGLVQYRPCRRMKDPDGPGPATVPVFSDFSARIDGLYPPLGRERLPLNLAFFKAAQWLLLRSQYEPDGPSAAPGAAPRGPLRPVRNLSRNTKSSPAPFMP